MQLKYVISMTVLFCCLGFAAWESVGPYGGYIRSVVVSHSNDNIVYVSSYSTPTSVAKTTNAGASWTTMGAIPRQVYCMAIDPGNDNNLYTGCGHAIYRSTDGGANWISTTMSNKYIYGIVVHPTTPSTIYASGMSWDGSQWVIAFFKSTNSGTSWSTTPLNVNRSNSYSIAVDRTNPNTVYVGGYYYHPVDSTNQPIIYKSTDGGTSFNEVTNNIPTTTYYVYSLAVHPTNSSIVYAGTYLGGIYRSIDGGSSWTQASTHYYNYSMTTSPAAPDIAYSGGYSDIYKTTDAGASWFASSTGMTGHYVYGLAMSPLSGSNVFAGSNVGIFKTTNSGTSWLNSTNNLNVGAILNFAVAPSSGSTVYTSFEEIGVYKTTNSGSSWTLLPTPVGCGDICEFAVDYASADIVYALEGSG